MAKRNSWPHRELHIVLKKYNKLRPHGIRLSFGSQFENLHVCPKYKKEKENTTIQLILKVAACMFDPAKCKI